MSKVLEYRIAPKHAHEHAMSMCMPMSMSSTHISHVACTCTCTYTCTCICTCACFVCACQLRHGHYLFSRPLLTHTLLSVLPPQPRESWSRRPHSTHPLRRRATAVAAALPSTSSSCRRRLQGTRLIRLTRAGARGRLRV